MSEAWGYRQLPLTVAPPVVDGRPLEFGPGQEDGQLAFLRHTPATGWRYEQTPLDEARQPVPRADPEPALRAGDAGRRRRCSSAATAFARPTTRSWS